MFILERARSKNFHFFTEISFVCSSIFCGSSQLWFWPLSNTLKLKIFHSYKWAYVVIFTTKMWVFCDFRNNYVLLNSGFVSLTRFEFLSQYFVADHNYDFDWYRTLLMGWDRSRALVPCFSPKRWTGGAPFLSQQGGQIRCPQSSSSSWSSSSCWR